MAEKKKGSKEASADNDKVYVARTSLYHTAERDRVVAAGDPDAVYFLAVPGQTLTSGQAKSIGLLDLEDEDRAGMVDESEVEPAPAPDQGPPTTAPVAAPAPALTGTETPEQAASRLKKVEPKS